MVDVQGDNPDTFGFEQATRALKCLQFGSARGAPTRPEIDENRRACSQSSNALCLAREILVAELGNLERLREPDASDLRRFGEADWLSRKTDGLSLTCLYRLPPLLRQDPAFPFLDPFKFFFRSARPADLCRHKTLVRGSKAKVNPLTRLAHQAITSVEGLYPALGSVREYEFDLRPNGIPGTFACRVARQSEGNPAGALRRNLVLKEL